VLAGAQAERKAATEPAEHHQSEDVPSHA
jgi:hypothetical protein